MTAAAVDPTNGGISVPQRPELDGLRGDSLFELNEVKRRLLSRGDSFFDLSMINPDVGPPRVSQDRLVEAVLQAGNHRYAVARGVRKLRQAFAAKYARRFGVSLDSDSEICVTLGAKDAAIQLLHLLAPLPGKVLFGAPTYPAFAAAAQLNGCSLTTFEMSRDESVMLDRIRATLNNEQISILFLNFPNNPTGITVSSDFHKRVVELARSRGVFVVNDFVYGEMCFEGGGASSLLSQGGGDLSGLVEIYSMSKAYSVPGWRVGAALGDSKVVCELSLLKAHLDYGTFLPLQSAAAATLAHPDDVAEPIRSLYFHRSSMLVDGLRRIGWDLTAPQAGCCVWGRLPESFREEGARSFCRRLLERAGVLALPGDVFGADYREFVRFASVLGDREIYGVLEQIESFQQGILGDEPVSISKRK